MENTTTYPYQSPIGKFTVVGDERGIQAIQFVDKQEQKVDETAVGNSIKDSWPSPVQQCFRQLDEYFAGKRLEFDVPLAPEATEFQQKVWDALLDIPWGRTLTYGNIAQQIGQPKAAQAVGAANGQNPIPIIVPCHRVVGSNGTLTGYAGGLWRKEWLLKHENVKLPGKQLSLLDF
ncbi:cysteine methyltransferase [marine bacterium AO1-C]|nr:cysteine methyltransferase [marine bacterium AO1-C]